MANVSRMEAYQQPKALDAATETAKLTIGDETWDFEVREGTIGPEVIDISTLYSETGRFTYDPGFTSTAACESKITFIDGDEGILLYRGYPIEQLAEHGDFLETCYLLLYGELPTAGAEGRLRPSRDLSHDGPRADEPLLHRLPPRRPSDGDHVRRRRRAVGLLSRLDRHHRTRYQRMVASLRMIAKMPTIAAMAFKYHIGQPFVYPLNALDYASNFLRMCFAVPCEEYKVNPGPRRGPWTGSSSSTPTTSRTPRPRRSVSPARRAPIRSPASPPASPASGARPMAAPTRRRSTCCRRSARSIASPNTSPAPRTRTIRSA